MEKTMKAVAKWTPQFITDRLPEKRSVHLAGAAALLLTAAVIYAKIKASGSAQSMTWPTPNPNYTNPTVVAISKGNISLSNGVQLDWMGKLETMGLSVGDSVLVWPDVSLTQPLIRLAKVESGLPIGVIGTFKVTATPASYQIAKMAVYTHEGTAGVMATLKDGSQWFLNTNHQWSVGTNLIPLDLGNATALLNLSRPDLGARVATLIGKGAVVTDDGIQLWHVLVALGLIGGAYGAIRLMDKESTAKEPI